jgi:plasmid stabilization system protein ParE
MWPVEFQDAAEEELTAAIDWYAGQNASAAVSFAGEVRDAVLSIAADPTRLPTLGPERRFLPVEAVSVPPGFPRTGRPRSDPGGRPRRAPSRILERPA